MKDMKKIALLISLTLSMASCSQNRLNIASLDSMGELPASYEEMSMYAETLDGFILEDGQALDSLFSVVLKDCNVPVACADSIEAKASLFRHAKELMDGILSIDSHCDFPERRYYHPEYGCDFGASRCDARFSLEKMRQGHIAAVCMAVWMRPGPGSQLDSANVASAPDSLWKFVEAMDAHFSSLGDRCGIASSRKEAEEFRKQGRKVVMYALESAHWIGNDLENIAKLADRGFVYITLSHQGDNQVCNSCNGSADPSSGLTEFGREVVREMNRQGIVIDLSHTSYGTQRDVLELSTSPVVYTHSCCSAIYDNPRNVDDETMKLLASKGGVIQITMFPGFMAPKGKRDGIGVDEFVRHICHAVDVVGIDHVGVGCDFDGGGRGVGLNGANDAVNLTMKLIEKGFSDEDIAKIWGGNFFRVLDEVQAKAGRQIADN